MKFGGGGWVRKKIPSTLFYFGLFPFLAFPHGVQVHMAQLMAPADWLWDWSKQILLSKGTYMFTLFSRLLVPWVRTWVSQHLHWKRNLLKCTLDEPAPDGKFIQVHPTCAVSSPKQALPTSYINLI